MELINNRYRVVRNMECCELWSSHLVRDLMDNNKEKVAFIVDDEGMGENLQNFFSSDYLVWKNLASPFILRNYEPEPVKTVAGKHSQNFQYFVLAEFAKNARHLNDMQERLPASCVLNVFAQACCAVHYLHIKNICYQDINFANVIILHEDGKFSLKLRDGASAWIYRISACNNDADSVYFKAPEALVDADPTPSADIYSLGVLLFCLIAGAGGRNRNFKADFDSFKRINTDELTAKFIAVINKATAGVSERHACVPEMLMDINDAFGTSFAAFDRAEVERLYIGCGIVGRNDERAAIMDNYDKVMSATSEKRLVCIHGEQGIGKTTLMTELKNRLYLKNANVLWSFGQKGDGALRAMLKQLAEAADYSGNTDAGFLKYITAFANGINTEASYDKNSITKFVHDCIRDKSVVIIIDDMEFADEFTINMIERLSLVVKRLNVVFSYRNGHSNKALLGLMARQGDVMLKVESKPLSPDDTAALIQNILRIQGISNSFRDWIYGTAHGNPLFIEEILKNLQANCIIYAHKESGRWHIDYSQSEYKNIALPTSIEQAIKEQADSVDGKSYRLLEVIAAFDDYLVSEAELCLLQAECTPENLNMLVGRGFLSAIPGKGGITYGISDKILKTYIYEKCCVDKLNDMHSQIASMLTDGDDLVELAYHLGKLGRKEQQMQCLVEYALRLYDMRDYTAAIEGFEAALEICRSLSKADKEVSILLDLGLALYDANRSLEAVDAYEQALAMAVKLELAAEKAAAEALLARYYILKLDFVKVKELLASAGTYFENLEMDVKLTKAHREYIFAALHSAVVGSTKEAFYKVYNSALARRGADRDDVKCGMLHRKGMFYAALGNTDRAFEVFSQLREYAEKTNQPRFYDAALSNIGTCYAIKGNKDMSLVIYAEVAETSQNPSVAAHAQINLGTSAAVNDPLKAQGIGFSALDSTLLFNNKSVELDARILIAIAAISNDNYELAIHQLEEVHKFVGDDPSSVTVEFVNVMVNFSGLYVILGDSAQAHRFGKNLLKHNDEKNRSKDVQDTLRTALINDELFAIAPEDRDTAETKRFVRERVEKIKLMPISNMYRTLPLCHRINLSHHIQDVFEEYAKDDIVAANVSVVPKTFSLYVQAIAKSGDERLELLQQALEKVKEQGRRRLAAYIYEDLSDFFDIGSYHWLNYLARACEAIQDILQNVPEQYHESFLARHRFIEPFRKIMAYKGMGVKHITFDAIASKDFLTAILSDPPFMQDAQAAYLYKLCNINSPSEVMLRLTAYADDNLAMFAGYVSAMCCASRCHIILESSDGVFTVIASTGALSELPTEYQHILRHTKTLSRTIIVAEGHNNINDDSGSLLPTGLKAAMCIPVYEGGKINSYIFAASDSMFNKIDREVAKGLEWVMPLINMNVTQHITEANSALDKLTGGLNRKFLEIAIDNHIEKARQTGGKFSIIMSDLDKFKAINDTYGHQAGDMVIRNAGKVIRDNLRKDTPFGRFGGEEFVVILDNADADDALIIAEKLRLAIESARLLGSRRPVTVSMGVATYGTHDNTKAGLLEKADKALYTCKENGRNRSEIYDPGHNLAIKSKNTTRGMVSGDSVKDAMRIRYTLDILELAKTNMLPSDRMDAVLAKIKGIAEAQNVYYFTINGNNASNIPNNCYNHNLVQFARNGIIAMAHGKEVAVPIEKSGSITGVLYLRATPSERPQNQYSNDFIESLQDLMAIVP
ncbi:MAG: diguanylate cyclase [Defluviitaleaceae bacterium]|nr:diguanylate cyclase [Defluviitaleaceae bacterium]